MFLINPKTDNEKTLIVPFYEKTFILTNELDPENPNQTFSLDGNLKDYYISENEIDYFNYLNNRAKIINYKFKDPIFSKLYNAENKSKRDIFLYKKYRNININKINSELELFKDLFNDDYTLYATRAFKNRIIQINENNTFELKSPFTVLQTDDNFNIDNLDIVILVGKIPVLLRKFKMYSNYYVFRYPETKINNKSALTSINDTAYIITRNEINLDNLKFYYGLEEFGCNPSDYIYNLTNTTVINNIDYLNYFSPNGGN